MVLIHAAVADSGMWRGTAERLRARGHDVVTPDLRGFGDKPLPASRFSNVEDIAQFLPAALVGNSFGGRVALETALAHPTEIDRLVLVSPALADHDWSDGIREYWRHEEELFERGEVEAAAELTLDVFALPHVHDTLRPMVRRSYELQTGHEPEVSWPEPRPLESLRPHTLVIVGEHDLRDFHAIAERIVREAPDARLEVVRGAKHVPSLEQPEAFEALVFPFLGG